MRRRYVSSNTANCCQGPPGPTGPPGPVVITGLPWQVALSNGANGITFGNFFYDSPMNNLSVGTHFGSIHQTGDNISIGANDQLNQCAANAVAIGNHAGKNQGAASIILNAAGTDGVNTDGGNAGFFVNPVRQTDTTLSTPLFYDPTSSEILYTPGITPAYNPATTDLDMALFGITGVADITPGRNNTYTLGTSGARWSDIWIGTGGIHLGTPNYDWTVSTLPDCCGYTDPNGDKVGLEDDIIATGPDGKIYSLIHNPGAQGATEAPVFNFPVTFNKPVNGPDATFDNITSTNATIGTLDVLTSITTDTLTTDTLTTDTLTAGTLTSNTLTTDVLTVHNEVNLSGTSSITIHGNMNIYGDEEIYGNEEIHGSEKIYGNLSVINGNSTLNGDVSITGKSTLNGDATINGNLTLNGDVSIPVGGGVNIDADIYLSNMSVLTGNGQVLFNGQVRMHNDVNFDVPPHIMSGTAPIAFAPTVYNTVVYPPATPPNFINNGDMVFTTSITTIIKGGVMLHGFLNMTLVDPTTELTFTANIGGTDVPMGIVSGSLNYHYPLVASLASVPAGINIPITVSITWPPVSSPDLSVSVSFGVLNVLGNLVQSP